MLLIQNSRSLDRDAKLSLTVLISTSLIALLSGYVFVEIYPVALIAKLQLARTTPFAQLAVLIALSVVINEQYQKGNRVLSLLLLVAPTFKDGAILLLILAVLLSTYRLRAVPVRPLMWLFLAIAFLVIELPLNPVLFREGVKQLGWKLILFLSLAFPLIWEQLSVSLRQKTIIAYGLASASSLFFILGLTGFLPQKLLGIFQERIQLFKIPTGEVQRLALRFKETSPEAAVVLVPPSEYSFRFYSQRSVVFDFKSFPFSDRGVQEWGHRLKTIWGENLTPVSLITVDRWYRDRSSPELEAIARQFHANYILTKTDWHPTMDGIAVAQTGKWIIYQIESEPAR